MKKYLKIDRKIIKINGNDKKWIGNGIFNGKSIEIRSKNAKKNDFTFDFFVFFAKK